MRTVRTASKLAAATAAMGAAALFLPAAASAATLKQAPVAAPTADGRVEASVTTGSTVVVGGSFDSVGGHTRHGIAAISAKTGALLPLDVTVSGTVTALATDGHTLWIGGDFSQVDGHSRANLAAVSLSSGALLSWNPGTNLGVEALAVSGSTVYVGGHFKKIAGAERPFLAAVNGTSGSVVPGFTAKGADAAVFVLRAHDGLVYAGGDFHRVAGVQRAHLAALSPNSGAPNGWAPKGLSKIYDLRIYDGSAYLAVAGGRQNGNRIVAVSTAGSGAVRWSAQANGNVQTVAIYGNEVYAGGHFGNVSGISLHHAVCLTTAGKVDYSWSPRFNSALGVWTMVTTSTGLVVGGDFSTIDSVSHPHLARFAG